jgi:phospho-N-acetylmuramoyl-pentapeptide-transferase
VISLLVAGGVAFSIAVFGTPILIRLFTRRQIGQPIREDGPRGHITKAGTPTMGGVALVAAALVGYGIGHARIGAELTKSGLVVMMVIAGSGFVGLVDDWIKVTRQRSLGLNKRAKFLAQLLVALTYALLAHFWVGNSTALSFTRYNLPGIDLGGIGWVVWAIFLVVGASNAVNLTDGLDGLAAGSSTFSFSALAIIGYWQFRHVSIYHVHHGLDLALAAVAMTGACAGFLWWNAAPARIIMGDTGSLAVGAGLAALCLEMNLQLLLPIIGGLFVIETLSVLIQVASFRFFHRRVFRMAPLHHHFELRGWPETTVITRFWILGGICTALAFGLFYADFLSFGLTS